MTNHDNPVSPAIQAIVDLFRDELGDVKFPDVDRAVLQAAIEGVTKHARHVADAQAALEASQRALQEAQDVLLTKTQRAMAYARIYAEDNPELLSRLDAVALPRGRRPARAESPVAVSSQPAGAPASEAPRRRGRPPKAKGGMLFADDSGGENSEAGALA